MDASSVHYCNGEFWHRSFDDRAIRDPEDESMTGWEQLIYKASPPTFRCGCPRTPINTLTQRYKGHVIRRCRACSLQRIYDAFHGGTKPERTKQECYLPLVTPHKSARWDAVYRGIIGWYRRKSYFARNPFFVQPYADDEGVMQ
jgi:hypothetical protein